MQALRRAIGQKVPDDLTSMDRRAIPDDHDPARHFAQEVLEKRDDVVRVDGMILAVEVELALGRDGTDGREVVARAPLPQDWSLAHRGVGADDAGQGIEARFV